MYIYNIYKTITKKNLAKKNTLFCLISMCVGIDIGKIDSLFDSLWQINNKNNKKQKYIDLAVKKRTELD